jgi:DNA-binding transcriptional LysR family regulator
VTAPPGVAFDLVAPFAALVRREHPAIQLEALSSVHNVDLTRGEADLALRVSPTASRDVVVIATIEVPHAIVAAASYVEKLPKKPRVEDLDWIAWAPPFEDVTPNPQLAAMIPNFRPVFTSDNYLVQWRACEAGVGVMARGHLRHRFALPTTVVTIDVPLGPYPSSTLGLACAKSALAIPRVRAVADLIAKEFERHRAGSRKRMK